MRNDARRALLKAADAGGSLPDRRQLEGVRRLGCALSHDELQEGLHGIAVPVTGADGTAVASMAILGPANRAGKLLQHVDRLSSAPAPSERLAESAPAAAA